MADGAATPKLTIVPANEASWEDLQTVLGTRGDPSRCQCQRYKMQPRESWASVGGEELAFRLRTQTDCGQPESRGDERPRRLSRRRAGRLVRGRAPPPPTRACCSRLASPGRARTEDKTDKQRLGRHVFVTRVGFRRRGVSRALARAAVDFARRRGARALEGYPMITQPGQMLTLLSELHVGSRSIFEDAGFAEVGQADNPPGRDADRLLAEGVSQSGLTSINPNSARGCLAAISTASSRLPHWIPSNPPTASLVSAKSAHGDDRLPVTDSDRARATRRRQLVAGDPDALRLDFIQPGKALLVRSVGWIGLGLGVHALEVPADQHHESHRRSFSSLDSGLSYGRRTRRAEIDIY